jgi:23S rRNA (cytidine1920-2'-O)/16S rRNA (cytidine1409-2'-O)-methyltransferase
MERINIRNVVPADLPYLPTFVVADLSFISLKTVLPALSQLIDPEGQMVLMVKPQFEAGKVIVSANHGVIRDPRVRASSVHSVALVAMELGWSVAGVAASPLPGPKGNVEYFLWLTHTNATSTLPPDSNAQQLEQWIDHVVEKGPQ